MLSRKICLMFTTLIMISGIMGCNVKPAEETSMSSVEVSTTSAPSPKKVGISMPTKALACWRVEGFAMKQQLEEAGYLVDLRFAGDNEPYMQIKQIESMIIGNCDLLIVTAVEGKPQEHALKPAKDKGIPAIAYDCLVRV